MGRCVCKCVWRVELESVVALLEQNRRHRACAAIAPAAAAARQWQKARAAAVVLSPSLCRQSNTFNIIITITMTRRLARIASA